MTATIHHLNPPRRIQDLDTQIRSLPMMTVELLRDHREDLSRNELMIVHHAKQLAELGQESPVWLMYVHQIYQRVHERRPSLLQRARNLFRRS